MSTSSARPQIWSAGILSNLERSHVFGSDVVVNRDYEGIITDQGSTVTVNRIGDVTISSYSGSDISLEELDTTAVQLVIDQANYFNFGIDDVEAGALGSAISRDLVVKASAKAAHGLRDAADVTVRDAILAAATGTANDLGDVTVDAAADLYELLVDAKVRLDEGNVTGAGRFVVLPSIAAGYLLKDNRFIVDGISTAARDNGEVFSAAGFRVLTSNNTGITAGVGPVVFGTNEATSFAEQIVKVTEYQPEKRFSSAVKGLHVFGCKVVRPECVGIADVTFG